MDETDIADFKLPIEEYNYVKLIFEREGVYVIPYPTDYKTDKEIAVDAFSFTPSAMIEIASVESPSVEALTVIAETLVTAVTAARATKKLFFMFMINILLKNFEPLPFDNVIITYLCIKCQYPITIFTNLYIIIVQRLVFYIIN